MSVRSEHRFRVLARPQRADPGFTKRRASWSGQHRSRKKREEGGGRPLLAAGALQAIGSKQKHPSRPESVSHLGRLESRSPPRSAPASLARRASGVNHSLPSFARSAGRGVGKARRFCSAGEERPRPRQIKPLRFDRLSTPPATSEVFEFVPEQCSGTALPALPQRGGAGVCIRGRFPVLSCVGAGGLLA